MEAHSERDGGRGGHAAELWLLSKGSVASSEQIKHWSQLNITFPFVHEPSEVWWMQREEERDVCVGDLLIPLPTCKRPPEAVCVPLITWRSDLLSCLIISQVFFQHRTFLLSLPLSPCHLLYDYLSILPDEHKFFSPVLVSIVYYKHRRLPLPFISSFFHFLPTTTHFSPSLHHFI